MLRFKQFLKLLEGKLEDFKATNPEINISHDSSAKLKTPDDIINHFHKANPTGNVNHTRKVLDWYNKGHFKQEDAPMVKNILTDFDKHKSKLAKKQLDQYKTPRELQAALNSFNAKEEEQTNEDADVIRKGAKVIHDSPKSTVYQLQDPNTNQHANDATAQLSAPTWCISKPNAGMHGQYMGESDNKGFIIHNHHEEYPHRKIGIYGGTREIQDESNTPLTLAEQKELLKRNPHLKEIPELQGITTALTKDPNKHIKELLDNDKAGVSDDIYNNPEKYSKDAMHLDIKHDRELEAAEDGDSSVKNSKFKSVAKKLAENTGNTDTLKHLSLHKTPSVRANVAKNYSTDKETIKRLAMNDPEPSVRGASSRVIGTLPKANREEIYNNETHPEVLTSHIFHEHDPVLKEKLYNHPNISDSGIADLVENGYKDSAEGHKEILNNKKTGSATLGALIKKRWRTPEFAHDILNHPNLSKDNLNEMAKAAGTPELHKEILKHKLVRPKTLEHIASNTRDPEIQKLLLNHPDISRDAIERITNKGNSENHKLIAEHPKTDSTILSDLAAESSDPEIHKIILNHPEVDRTILSRLARKKQIETQRAVLEHPKTTDNTLATLANYSTHPEIHKGILNHPEITNQVLDNLVSNSHPDLHKAILNHPETKESVLDELSAYSNDPEIHKGILNHSQVGRHTIDRLSRTSKNPEVRSLIADHKKSGVEALRNIRDNNSPELKQKINNRLNKGYN